MKLRRAKFTFDHPKHGLIVVIFQPRSADVAVYLGGLGGQKITYTNATGEYKPCVTHCNYLIRLATNAKPANRFDEQRRAKTRTQLKLVTE